MLLLTQLTDDNYLFVHEHGAIEIADETAIFYNDTIHGILSQPPTGEVLKFDDLELRCKCTDEYCPTRITVRCNGEITINENGKSLTAKVDPRYTSQIYMATCPIDQYNDLIRQGVDKLGDKSTLVDIKDVEAGQWLEWREDLYMRMNRAYDEGDGALLACVTSSGDMKYINGQCHLVNVGLK